jgi:hypothetical protein
MGIVVKQQKYFVVKKPSSKFHSYSLFDFEIKYIDNDLPVIHLFLCTFYKDCKVSRPIVFVSHKKHEKLCSRKLYEKGN